MDPRLRRHLLSTAASERLHVGLVQGQGSGQRAPRRRVARAFINGRWVTGKVDADGGISFPVADAPRPADSDADTVSHVIMTEEAAQ